MTVSKVLIAAFAVLCSSCAPSRRTPEVARVRLPEAYETAPRQPSVAPIPWREYFKDGELIQLVTRALEHNLDLRIALQRIEVARAGVRQATGAQFPQVALVAGSGIRKFGLYTMDGAGNAGTDIRPGQLVPTHLPDFYVGLEAGWEVDLWGRLRHLRESALAQYLATVEGTKLVITNLVSEVAVAYFDLAALDRTLEILGQTIARQEEALEAMRVQKAAGRVNELAVQQFAGQLASTRALEASLGQQAREVENRINVLVGSLPQSVARAKNALAERSENPIPLGVPSDLLRNRPDIREAELRMSAAECDVEAARAAFYPSVNITGAVGYQAFNPRFLFSTPESVTYSLAGGLVAPLVNRSGIEAQFEAASALQIQAMYEYQRTILEGFVEVATSLAAVERANEIVEHRSAQREAVAETITTADLLFKTGRADYLEVLTAQQNALTAELELLEALKTQRVSRILLYKALGGGWH